MIFDTSTKAKLKYTSWILLLSIVVVFSFIACGFKEKTVSEDFINAYCDLRIASENFGHDKELAQKKRLEILKKYKLSADDFDDQVKLIKNMPSQWSIVQEKIIARLDVINEDNTKKLKRSRDAINKNVKPNKNLKKINSKMKSITPKPARAKKE